MARIVRVKLFIADFPVDLEVLERLAEVGGAVARLSSEENFNIPVEVDLDLAEGSLELAGVVIGTLFSTYYAVGKYKAFKESVVEICEDAKTFGDTFCDKFLQKARISKSQISKQKVEVQTPERLRALLDELERLDGKWQALSEGSRTVVLARAASKLDRVLRDLNDADRSAVVASLSFEALPPYTQWPRKEQLRAHPRRRTEKRRALSDQSVVKQPAGQRKKLRVKKKVFIEPRVKGAHR